MRLHWLPPEGDPHDFPDAETALAEPNGLLAVGGDLSPERLVAAYSQGIFPWYQNDQPILWWSPEPRAVLFPEEMHVSRSLRRTLKHAPFKVGFDQAFDAVINHCAAPRPEQGGETWITPAMAAAYTRLFELDYAHSVEVWHAGELAGGLYGVAIGSVFFGESMFTRITNASKVALVHLTRQLGAWDFTLLDCQIESAHLASLGSRMISRMEFLHILQQATTEAPHWGGALSQRTLRQPIL